IQSIIDIWRLPPAKFSVHPPAGDGLYPFLEELVGLRSNRLPFEDRGREENPACLCSFAYVSERSLPCSISAIGEQEGRDRDNQYFRVQGHRPIPGIKHITGNTLVIRRRATTGNLPEPGYAWPARKISAY